MQKIFTIGYEGTDIPRFVATLKCAGIEQLIDVRAVAISRKKGFSKKALASNLSTAGIEYAHLGALGDPKAGRTAAKAGRYEEFREIYTEHFSSPDAQESFKQLMMLASMKASCLLCFEREPKTCHRSIITEEMVLHGFETFDLYGDDPERYVRNSIRMSRPHPCESVAAAQ